MLGYRGHETWRDMSEYALHFTKDTEAGDSSYSVMLKILWSGRLLPSGPFGAARKLGALGESQKSVCFSEIPLDKLDRLVERRSKYGIAFTQKFLVENGGARVWYVENGGSVATTLRGMVSGRAIPGMGTGDDLWSLTPFIEFPSADYDYQFEWEREWRVPGELSFTPDDVAFLFIPEELHPAARAFFHEAEVENSGPAYLCPYLDPLWNDERLQAAFAENSL